ncbi:MAG: hypothetical protein DWB42_13015 [Chloroflexi bacterium]|nr:hypothetical protein [Chloroflexota bacterium]MDL1884201.1 hypothetical protein [Anaerolineae bacterium CFX8]
MKLQRVLTIILVLSVLMMAFSSAGALDAAPRVWLSAAAEQAAAGQSVVITVHIAGAAQIYGGSFELAYDPEVLEVVLAEGGEAVQPGDFFGSAPNFPLMNSAGAGVIEYAMTLVQPAEPVSGDGVLGTITLRALKDTVVQVTPVEVSLVSPQFVEVDGRKVAQSINTIVPEVAGLDTTAIAQNPPAQSGVAAVSLADTAKAPAEAAVNVPVESAMAAARSANDLAFILAGALFMVGMALLVISVGLYTRMRSIHVAGE